MQGLPLYIFLGLLAINALTFFLYGHDKRAARNGGWRVSESTLLLLALFGGTPAAYIARKYFRHKTIKSAFIVRLWFVIILQLCACLAYAFYTYG